MGGQCVRKNLHEQVEAVFFSMRGAIREKALEDTEENR
jgi:hypothetical protein